MQWLRDFLIYAMMPLLVLFIAPASYGAVAVLYPKVSSPYSEIFDEIISGIQSQHGTSLQIKAIAKNESPDSLSAWVDEQNPDMLIALGRRGYQFAKGFDKNKPVVVGALPIKPNGISGISLLADPKVLFDALQNLAPNIQRVYVVYSQRSEWLIGLAEEQSKMMGLTLIKVKAEDVKAAAKEYDSLLSRINVQTDAVWLPLDAITANEQVILPSLLERTWEQNIVLFSSKPAHAKRGALFSMLPDNYEMGKQLVSMVKSMHQRQVEGSVLPLDSMRLAVNLRTAAHLGFEYKNRQKQQFYVTFPQ